MKLTRYFLIAALMLTACGGAEDVSEVNETNDATSADESMSEGQALSISTYDYYFVRRDFSKCAFPRCSGWYAKSISDQNAKESYFTNFEISPSSGLSAADKDVAMGASSGYLIVKARQAIDFSAPPQGFRFYRKLIATQAYRGLPNFTIQGPMTFATVKNSPIYCFTAPCPQLLATVLRSKTSTTRLGVDTTFSYTENIDQTWLNDEIVNDGAIVAGKITSTPTDGATFLAAQVFIRLPEREKVCPTYSAPVCSNGTYATFMRDENRCMTKPTCEAPRPCPYILDKMCNDGYRRAQVQNSCPRSACDPEWVAP